MVVTVDVAKDLNRRLEVLDEIGLGLEYLGDLVYQLKHLVFPDMEWFHQWNRSLSLHRLEEILDEE